MLDKQLISRNFSLSAPDYERHARLQTELADELFSSLTGFDPKQVLDLGCGTGYLTRKIADRFPAAAVVGIDIAPGMIAVAQMKSRCRNLTFAIGDGESPAMAEGAFDLIVSNASLQWMKAGNVLAGAFATLRSGGRFIFNTFGPRTLQELKMSGFHVNDFQSVNQLIELADGRFRISAIRSRVIPQRFGSVKELVLHLKEVGAHQPHRRPKGDTLSSIKKYKQKHSQGNQVIASYEVISGHLIKP